MYVCERSASGTNECEEDPQIKDSSVVSPLEHLLMSSDDWSQAATLAWLLQLKGKDAAESTVDCLRKDMHCNGKQTQRSVQ